jgi:alkylated DNA repair protein alkB family protein 1
MRLQAQAGIVNLYAAGKRSLPMGAHVDDMERDLRFPVLSASIGCAAVFLVGGASKDDAPTPLLLRSGDVLVLSGASRLAWHGVAAVLPGTCPPELFEAAPAGAGAGAGTGAGAGDADDEAAERADMRAFLLRNRINFNLRQVVAGENDDADSAGAPA